MRLPAYLTTLFFASVLTACGGGGDPVASSSTDGEDSTGDTGASVDSTVVVGNAEVGTGSGESYQDGALEITSSALSAGGSTLISANIVDADNDNQLVTTQEYSVVFSSACAAEGKAVFSESDKFVSSGRVTVNYTASGCEGEDEITFTIYNSENGAADVTEVQSVAKGTVSIAPQEIGTILYVGTETPAISIKTIGNATIPKQSVLVFQVLDKDGNPVANREVTFGLSVSTGGIELSQNSVFTNDNGEVQAIVNAGTSHATTSVIASTTATDGESIISTTSSGISVTTGIVDQDSFEIVTDILNPGGYDYSGEVITVSANAADQFQNPVPDGTVINFTAESGVIESTCETVGGTCSVTWYSSGVRPGNADAGLQRVNELDPFDSSTIRGMTTIMAYTIGEHGFTDSNNNGMYDIGEPFVSYAEPFRDDDWDSVHDTNGSTAVEFFADFDANGARDAAPAVYQGALCSEAAKAAGHCAGLSYIGDSLRIVQSERTRLVDSVRYFVSNRDGSIEEVSGSSYSRYFYVVLQDGNGNIPHLGSSMTAGAEGYDVAGGGDVPNSPGFINQNASPTGIPVNRGAVFGVAATRTDGDRGPLEISATNDAGILTSTIWMRENPTVTFYYRSGNGDLNADGDARDLGEDFQVYTGQKLASPAVVYAVLQDPDFGSLPSYVTFNATQAGDATIAQGVKQGPLDIAEFPVEVVGFGADVYEITVTQGTDPVVALEFDVEFTGGWFSSSALVDFL
ncbi:hypothetical protein [Thalassolituus maritimus]|uniref:Big-1 domain-containing protein n=1 Tax=Thalassolituus maritimus TaxID=484498 RepID=A0ABQ0A364_9GAMM